MGQVAFIQNYLIINEKDLFVGICLFFNQNKVLGEQPSLYHGLSTRRCILKRGMHQSYEIPELSAKQQ